MPDKKTCFIIMPVSTPEIYLNLYNNDKDHFRHVLSELFVPAITQAGYEAIEPIAKGSDLIHAEIIKNLESSDLVLCDMSILNPNVFFEFGIRTALNKPVCVVKDQVTKSIPFDTGIINHHEYNSELHAWIVKQEIPKLINHLKESESRSNGQNNLWRYFGLKEIGKPLESVDDQSFKLDLIFNQLEAINRQLITDNFSLSKDTRNSTQTSTHKNLIDALADYFYAMGFKPVFPSVIPIGSPIEIKLDKHLNKKNIVTLQNLVHQFGVSLRLKSPGGEILLEAVEDII